MAQICERRKTDVRTCYPLPSWGYRTGVQKRISLPSRKSHYEPIESVHDIFEPIMVGIHGKTERPRLCIRDFKEILEIEKQLLETSLEKSSIELCSKLRSSIGLSKEFEADGNALVNLDGFLADLADEEVDSAELVRATRRRL